MICFSQHFIPSVLLKDLHWPSRHHYWPSLSYVWSPLSTKLRVNKVFFPRRKTHNIKTFDFAADEKRVYQAYCCGFCELVEAVRFSVFFVSAWWSWAAAFCSLDRACSRPLIAFIWLLLNLDNPNSWIGLDRPNTPDEIQASLVIPVQTGLSWSLWNTHRSTTVINVEWFKFQVSVVRRLLLGSMMESSTM